MGTAAHVEGEEGGRQDTSSLRDVEGGAYMYRIGSSCSERVQWRRV
jgi:hypothetical protein